MASIGTLHGVLTLKSDQYTRGIRMAEQVTKAFRGTVLKLGAQFLTFQAAWSGVTGAIRRAKELTDLASQTRTNIEALQALNSVARDTGAQHDHLRQGLSKLITTAEDAAAGNKEYGKAFKALNVDIDAFLRMPTERRLEAVAKGFVQAENKSEAYRAVVRLLSEDTGPRLIGVLQRVGTQGLDPVIQKARDAGEVLSELDAQKLDRLADTTEKWKTRMLVAIGEVVAGVDDLITKMQGGGINQAEKDLIDARLQATREMVQRRLPEEFFRDGRDADFFARQLLSGDGRSVGVGSTLERMRGRGMDFEFSSADIAERDARIEEILNERARKAIEERRKQEDLDAKLRLQHEVDTAFKAVDEASDKHLKELEAYGESLSDALMTPWERLKTEIPKLHAAYEAGFITAETANRRIAELEADIAKEGEKANEVARELGLTFTSAFEDAVIEGEKLSDVLRAVGKDIARLFLRKQITEPLLGSIGNFLGGIFGGARADGGPVSAGRTYLVGEHGAELFTPPTSGMIVPNSRLAMAGGRGGNVYNIDARGADAAAVARLERMIVALNGSVEYRAVAAVEDARRRNRAA